MTIITDIHATAADAAKAADAANCLLTYEPTGDVHENLEWALRYLMDAAEKRVGSIDGVSATVILVLLERHDADVICEWVHDINGDNE